MESSQNIHSSHLIDVQWTNPLQNQRAFCYQSFYSFGTQKGHNQPNLFKKQFKNMCIPKQKFIKRQEELKQLQHQNYIPVQIRNLKFQKVNNQEIISECILISPYVNSVSVSKFIKQKSQLYLSNFIAIIQQVVNIMHFAQSKQIYHYHLNSNSILFIQNDNHFSSEYFLKICDWGFQNEVLSRKATKKTPDYLKKICQSSMFQYFHPELLFEIQNAELYQNYKSKYDIWSFGIILYHLAFFKHPFEQNGSFFPQKLQEFYKKNKDLKIEGHGLLYKLIEGMLSTHGFKNWSDIKAFMIVESERVELDFLGIKQIYAKHMNLMNYMVQIYKLTAWSISNSANCFWYENRTIMKEFLGYLLKLMLLLHSTKFIQRFGHRINYLSEQQKNNYFVLETVIIKQLSHVSLQESCILSEMSFFAILEKFTEYLLPLQTRIQDYSSKKSQTEKSSIGVRIRQTWKSMIEIKQFSSRMIRARNKIQNCNRKIFQCLFQICN